MHPNENGPAGGYQRTRKSDRVHVRSSTAIPAYASRGKAPPRLVAHRRIADLGSILRHRFGNSIPATDDRSLVVEIVGHHLAHLPGPLDKRLASWTSLWAPEMEKAELAEIADRIARKPIRYGADTLAHRLNVNMAERTRLRLTTIGACDLNKEGREELRKEKKRRRDAMRAKAKRRAAGAKPREESASRTKPWLALGMSRRDWYRKGKPTPGTKTSPPKDSNCWATNLCQPGGTVAPAAYKRPASRSRSAGAPAAHGPPGGGPGAKRSALRPRPQRSEDAANLAACGAVAGGGERFVSARARVPGELGRMVEFLAGLGHVIEWRAAA